MIPAMSADDATERARNMRRLKQAAHRAAARNPDAPCEAPPYCSRAEAAVWAEAVAETRATLAEWRQGRG